MKPDVPRPGSRGIVSLPPRERELKRDAADAEVIRGQSLPPRERELKLVHLAIDFEELLSLPPRERELKLNRPQTDGTDSCRSPRGSVN